jgi:hypothetical protein
MLSKTEEAVIRNVIGRLRCEPRGESRLPREADEVREALRGPAKLYLETWVIGALEHLLPESRNPDLARRLSR